MSAYIPCEILHHIFRFCCTDTLRQLRLTFNSNVTYWASNVLFTDLRVDLNDGKRSKRLVQSIASGRSTIGRHVRRLHFISANDWGPDETKTQPASELFCIESLGTFFLRLESLDSFIWDLDNNLLSAIQLRTIGNLLSSLEQLRHLDLRIDGVGPGLHYRIPNFCKMKALKSFSLTYNGFYPPALLHIDMAVLLRNSPTICSVHINDRTESQSIWRIPYTRGNAEPSIATSTRHPELHFVNFCLSPSVLKQQLGHLLPRLQSLTVHAEDMARSNEIPWAELWRCLASYQTRLSTLSVMSCGESFQILFEYLLSYHGLKGIEIRATIDILDSPKGTQQQLAGFGKEFWASVIPRHESTLKEIRMLGMRYVKNWGYGRVASAALRRCSALCKISLYLSELDFEWSRWMLADQRQALYSQYEIRLGWELFKKFYGREDFHQMCLEFMVELPACPRRTISDCVQEILFFSFHRLTKPLEELELCFYINDAGWNSFAGPPPTTTLERLYRYTDNAEKIILEAILGVHASGHAASILPRKILFDGLILKKMSQTNGSYIVGSAGPRLLTGKTELVKPDGILNNEKCRRGPLIFMRAKPKLQMLGQVLGELGHEYLLAIVFLLSLCVEVASRSLGWTRYFWDSGGLTSGWKDEDVNEN